MEEYGKLRRLPLPGQADADWWPRTRWPMKTEKKKHAVLQEKMCRACCEEPTATLKQIKCFVTIWQFFLLLEIRLSLSQTFPAISIGPGIYPF